MRPKPFNSFGPTETTTCYYAEVNVMQVDVLPISQHYSAPAVWNLLLAQHFFENSSMTVFKSTLKSHPFHQAHNKRQQLEKLQSSASERPQFMPKAAAIHYLNVYHCRKSRSMWAKNKYCGCRSPKYERFRSSYRRTGTGKPKSRSRRFDIFCERQGHIYHIPLKTIPSWLCRIKDNVTVAVIVSEIWAFKYFPLNVNVTKVGQSHLQLL